MGTLENVDSLSFDVALSDDSLAQVKATEFENPKTPFAGGQVAERAVIGIVPKGKEGSLELKVKLSGYRPDVLSAANIKNPPPLPKVVDDDDEDDEEEDEYD